MSDIWGDFITFKLIKLFRPGINEAANSWLVRIWAFIYRAKAHLIPVRCAVARRVYKPSTWANLKFDSYKSPRLNVLFLFNPAGVSVLLFCKSCRNFTSFLL